MSKSVAVVRSGHALGLVDPPELIRETIMRAVTDAGAETRFDHASAGVKNLLALYEVLSGQDRSAIQAHFAGGGYGFLKHELVDLVTASIASIRQRYLELMADPTYLEEVLVNGAERARPVAEATLRRAQQLIGVGRAARGAAR